MIVVVLLVVQETNKVLKVKKLKKCLALAMECADGNNKVVFTGIPLR